MKLFTLIFSFFNLVTINESLSVNSTYMNKYLDFLKQYNKNYSQKNFLIFKENVKFVENHTNDSFNVSINLILFKLW